MAELDSLELSYTPITHRSMLSSTKCNLLLPPTDRYPRQIHAPALQLRSLIPKKKQVTNSLSFVLCSPFAGTTTTPTDNNVPNTHRFQLVSPMQQPSAFQSGKIGRSIGGVSDSSSSGTSTSNNASPKALPKIEQKLINKEIVSLRQNSNAGNSSRAANAANSSSKNHGNNGKLAAAPETTAKNADGSPNAVADDTATLAMSFGTVNWTTISTQIGATALIPCTVHAIGEGVVSDCQYLYSIRQNPHSTYIA